jgi:hypothetical protein
MSVKFTGRQKHKSSIEIKLLQHLPDSIKQRRSYRNSGASFEFSIDLCVHQMQEASSNCCRNYDYVQPFPLLWI